MQVLFGFISIASQTWTDYDGDYPYRDFTNDGAAVTNSTSYVPGLWNDAGGAHTLVSTTWYYYLLGVIDANHNGQTGNVQRIVTSTVANPNHYTSTLFGYALNRRTVTYVIGESWDWDGWGTCVASTGSNYTVSNPHEFRYDGARARYLDRKLNYSGGTLSTSGDTWSDYDGGDVYADFTVSGSTATTTTKYQPGVWNTDGGSSQYLHNNHLGTLEQTTGSTGSAGSHRVFTAFGERITGPTDRLGFAGSEGYQASSEFSFLHLGARYYDPSSGRFLQRDPIGIRAGLNVYSYVRSSPSSYIDPSGLFSAESGLVGGVAGGIVTLGGAILCASNPIGWAVGAGLFGLGFTGGFVANGYQDGDIGRLLAPPAPPPPPVNLPPVIFMGPLKGGA